MLQETDIDLIYYFGSMSRTEKDQPASQSETYQVLG
jgi:hypothetical protein